MEERYARLFPLRAVYLYFLHDCMQKIEVRFSPIRKAHLLGLKTHTLIKWFLPSSV